MEKKIKVKPLGKEYYDKYYIVNGNVNESHYYVEISKQETTYDANNKCLRIVYRSDGPNIADVETFIKDCYPELSKLKPLKYYFDEPWHFTEKGNAYGLIFVFYK